VGWSALSNILFGHQTYFRSRGLDGHEDPEPFFDAHDAAPSSQPTPPGPHNFPQGPAPAYTQPTPPGPQISPQTPPPTYTQALSTPDRLQALLPQDLVTSEVLTILSPYDVTRALPTCQFLNQAGEQPAYWNAASVHLTAAWIGPPDTPSTAEEGEEDKKGWDLSACENPKLDFFRRMFIFPYQITEGHITRTSCRVIVKGRVRKLTAVASNLSLPSKTYALSISLHPHSHTNRSTTSPPSSPPTQGATPPSSTTPAQQTPPSSSKSATTPISPRR